MSPVIHVPARGRRERLGDRGLTLVELMVSMVLAIMLSAGLFYMMSGQQKTYSLQLSTMTSQENLWGAMEYLQGEVRKAGYGFAGCIPDYVNSFNSPTLMRWSSAAISAPKVSAWLSALVVANNSNLFTGTTGGTDSLQVAYAVDTGNQALTAARTISALPDPTDSVITANAPAGISVGDLLVLWQHGSTKHCTVVEATQVTSNSGNTVIRFDGGATSAFNPPAAEYKNIFPVSGGYAARSLVMRIGTNSTSLQRSFAIDNSKPRQPPRLVTWVGTNTAARQVVAEGIEDMQIAWACDANNDGLLLEGANDSAKLNDEWANNVASESSLPACGTSNNPIQALRITLIARTVGPTSNKTGYRPAAEDRAAGTPNQDMIQTGHLGTYGRAVLTSVIQPRNIRRSAE